MEERVQGSESGNCATAGIGETEVQTAPPNICWDRSGEEQEKKRIPVDADNKDRAFAWVYLLLGYGFIYVFSSPKFVQNFSVFVLVYPLVVMAYLFSKGKKPEPESYFWLAILWGMGIPFAWWTLVPLLQLPAVIFVAAYWTLTACGGLMERGRTSQWILCDSWNAVGIVPFSNFICHLKVLIGGGQREHISKPGLGKRLLTVGLGICIAIPVLIVAIPLLSSADAEFGKMMLNSRQYLEEQFGIVLLRVLFSLPVTAYLFGLVYGGIHRRCTDRMVKEDIQDTVKVLRVVPDGAVHTALFVVCLVYVLFIGFQAKYLFSAFVGIRPEEFTYAEYARQGFFELCSVAMLNLAVLFGANIFSRTRRSQNVWLRRGNVWLSVLTLLLVLTAMSKMLLYIGTYGLTEKRILTMVSMIWMLIVFLMAVIWQYREIPIVRIGCMAGAVLFCLLCVVPVEDCMIQFNNFF